MYRGTKNCGRVVQLCTYNVLETAIVVGRQGGVRGPDRRRRRLGQLAGQRAGRQPVCEAGGIQPVGSGAHLTGRVIGWYGPASRMGNGN